MKNFKNREEFINSINEARELSIEELESKKKANWKFVSDLIPDGESEPLVRKGDKVWFDEPGERLVIVDGSNPGMVVDLTYDELERHAIKLWESGSFNREAFPVYKVKHIEPEKGDAEKLAEYIEDFHGITMSAGSDEPQVSYYEKEYLEKHEGVTAKEFRKIVEEEAERLGMNVHVSIVRMFDDGTGDTREV